MSELVHIKVLFLCASDILVARKIYCFMGHASIKDCSFCNISFQDEGDNRYCGAVDYTKRTQDHENSLSDKQRGHARLPN